MSWLQDHSRLDSDVYIGMIRGMRIGIDQLERLGILHGT